MSVYEEHERTRSFLLGELSIALLSRCFILPCFIIRQTFVKYIFKYRLLQDELLARELAEIEAAENRERIRRERHLTGIPNATVLPPLPPLPPHPYGYENYPRLVALEYGTWHPPAQETTVVVREDPFESCIILWYSPIGTSISIFLQLSMFSTDDESF